MSVAKAKPYYSGPCGVAEPCGAEYPCRLQQSGATSGTKGGHAVLFMSGAYSLFMMKIFKVTFRSSSDLATLILLQVHLGTRDHEGKLV